MSAKNKPVTWTARAVQYAIAVQLDFFKYCIVPNIRLGSNDDMDLAILSPSKLLWEVEIKVTMFDWKRDLEKLKWQMPVRDCTPARFYYAVPWKLVPENDVGNRTIPDWLPSHAGVIAIGNSRTTKSLADGSQQVTDKPSATILRTAKPRHRTPLADKYVDEMYRKLSIRYWKAVCMREPGEKIILPES